MSGSVNKVIILGRVGRDPEVKSFPSGDKIAELSVATSERWTDKQSGERKEKTEWHRVVVRGDGLVRVVENYLRKGAKVYVEGKLQTRKWQDQSGQDRYQTEVVVSAIGGNITLLDGAGGEQERPRQEQPKPRQRLPQEWHKPARSLADDLDDLVPF